MFLMLLAIGPLEGTPGAPETDLRQAEEALAGGHYGEAIASFEILRASWPDDARVLKGLARALTARHRYRAADEVYRDMEDRRIEPILAHLQRAHLCSAPTCGSRWVI
jgi:pentatricopeptide repeat protein